MFDIGDLVEIKTNVVIPAFAGSTGIITRKLRKNAKDNVSYYEVDIPAQGRHVLLERELTLLRKA